MSIETTKVKCRHTRHMARPTINSTISQLLFVTEKYSESLMAEDLYLQKPTQMTYLNVRLFNTNRQDWHQDTYTVLSEG